MMEGDRARGAGTWIVLPTYDEADNVGPITAAILLALPEAHILVVDDDSPDGTGRIADELAASDARIRVRHRAAKQGLGRAYLDGFAIALESGGDVVVQMDADFSHDPNDLPRLLAPLMTGSDLVLGTRYMKGGGTIGWPLRRKLVSRAGTTFARVMLLMPYRDLTGGFKAWRRELLEGIRLREANASGYGFQIETTWWAHRKRAVVTQIPIVFRERVAGSSKMSGGIVGEALGLVLRLRLEAIRDAFRRTS